MHCELCHRKPSFKILVVAVPKGYHTKPGTGPPTHYLVWQRQRSQLKICFSLTQQTNCFLITNQCLSSSASVKKCLQTISMRYSLVGNVRHNYWVLIFTTTDINSLKFSMACCHLDHNRCYEFCTYHVINITACHHKFQRINVSVCEY